MSIKRIKTFSFRHELLHSPTPVMRDYLNHFKNEADQFIHEIEAADKKLRRYSTSLLTTEDRKEMLAWSSAYFWNSINSCLASTRLFLCGHVVAAGNQARHAVESLAFGVLLPFPATGTYKAWKQGHALEHKSLELLARHANHCGVNRKSVQLNNRQVKFYDQFSHPSLLAIAANWNSASSHDWKYGPTFYEERMPQYTKEIKSRISLGKFIQSTIEGTTNKLVKDGLAELSS